MLFVAFDGGLVVVLMEFRGSENLTLKVEVD